MTEPYYSDDLVTLYHGDCLEVMRGIPNGSVEAVVTDPPYGLGFMGKAWDSLPPGEDWALECLRVLKPGGYLLAFGGTRTWHRLAVAVEDAGFEIRDSIAWMHGQGFPKGKANLKPAFEPIVVGRKKPPVGGGLLNIDATRIGAGEDRVGGGPRPGGRWPANVVLDGDMAAALDQQSGIQRDGVAVRHRGVPSAGVTGWGAKPEGTPDMGYGSGGGASRFFYVAKASRSERPHIDGTAHPTVKPLKLMRWLVRLVTPEGGIILDPFVGSGTTIEAALLEGFDVIGIEREAEYLPLIQARIDRVAA